MVVSIELMILRMMVVVMWCRFLLKVVEMKFIRFRVEEYRF